MYARFFTEISTGAQREHRVDVLIEQAREKGLDPEELDFYLDFFRHGVPPHGGFGMGLARFLMLLLGLAGTVATAAPKTPTSKTAPKPAPQEDTVRAFGVLRDGTKRLSDVKVEARNDAGNANDRA